MKITSSDTTRLEAIDKAYAQLITGITVTLVGLGMAGFAVAGRQNIVALIGLVVLVIGVLIVLFRKQRTLVVDKGTGQLSFQLKSLVKKGDYTYAISDVTKVEFTSQYETTNTASNTSQGRSGLSFGTGGVSLGK